MGVMWTVWPLDSDMMEWLSSQEIVFPKVTSRFPTGREINHALSQMNLRTEFNDNGHHALWQVLVERGPAASPEWANLMVLQYSGEDEPQELYFEKGHETLIVDILRQLVPMCGPLVLVNDAGDPPEVVTG